MRILANRKIKLLFGRIMLCMFLFTLFSAFFAAVGLENSVLYIWLCFLSMGTVIMAVCYQYFKEQDQIMENAVERIQKYIAGSRDARIESNEEGELYRLFHEVNSLAAVLNTHAESEEKAKEFLKNIISDISHQLKTPLAALNIYNGIIQEEAKDLPTIREFTDYSEQELDRIESLVQNLLNIAKFDAGTIMLEKTAENISDMMESVRNRFSFRAAREGKEIRLAGDKGLLFSCDRNWMMEAMGNIVKNALDHTKQGDLVLIEWKLNVSIFQITIRDNGCGIHPEDIYHIFKRFYRSRYSKDTKGIGLGLPLAKSIIEVHNGTVQVDSEPGAGTVFRIHFLIPTKL